MQNPFKEENLGFDCTEEIDGSKTCKRIERKKGEMYATGTEVIIDGDPNTCKARISGRVMEKDKQAVEQEAKAWEDKCKKGY